MADKVKLDIYFKKSFQKEFAKLPKAVQAQFWTRLPLLLEDFYHPQLHVHTLKGEFQNFFSMNVSGDYRAIFETVGQASLYFYRIGTHSQLYK